MDTGKKAGEFYTPHGPAQILCRIAMSGQENKKGLQVYDPCMGSASLMISCRNYSKEPDYIKYYGQELMPSTYNLADTYVFVRDFLPGDDYLQGEVVNLHITKDDLMPLYWIKSRMVYSKKRKTCKMFLWETHYSTGYSGASQPDYHPTVRQVKKWAGQEKKGVSVQKCILAYHIRNGKLIDMKEGHS